MSDAHDDDKPNTSSTLSHRLPTISASQALFASSPTVANGVSIGLKSLDALISRKGNDGGTPALKRGHATELYGPPGVGKTTICMQAAASALASGDKVVWLDCSTQLAIPRLQTILSDVLSLNPPAASSAPQPNEHQTPSNDPIQNLIHYHLPHVPHLLALIVQAPTSFPPRGTSLIVLSKPATLIDAAYPRDTRPKASIKRAVDRNSQRSKQSTDRRSSVIADIAHALTRVAALRNVAIIVTNHVVTQVKGSGLAFLRPALSTIEWEGAMSSRVLLFRDWATQNDPQANQTPKRMLRSARFARVLKADGAAVTKTEIVAFEIQDQGVRELDGVHLKASEAVTHGEGSSRKRAHDESRDGEEIGSDDEYGWTEEDVQIAAEGLVDERWLRAGKMEKETEAED